MDNGTWKLSQLIAESGLYSYTFLILPYIFQKDDFGILRQYKIIAFENGRIVHPATLPDGMPTIMDREYGNAYRAAQILKMNGYASEFKAADNLCEAINYIITED